MIAAILEHEPAPVSALQPMAPPMLDWAVWTCLAKDPDERWQSAHDLVKELRWIAEASAQAGVSMAVTGRPRQRERALVVAMGGFALLSLVLAMLLVKNSPPQPELLVTSVAPPEGAVFDPAGGPMAFSPEGRRLAFVARTAEQERLLWVRALDRPSPQPLPGTDDAFAPFWSPDGHFIGFFADGKLKKVDASGGGPPETLCQASGPRGGTWNQEGDILFASRFGQPIRRVSQAGGIPTPATKLDEPKGELAHNWPSFLPDGRHFLYLAWSPSSSQMPSVHVASLDGEEPTPLFATMSNTVYAPPGYVLFWRDGSLRAQEFDTKHLRTVGEPFSVAPQVRFSPWPSVAIFSVSATGLLAYQAGGLAGSSQLVFFDRQGREIESVGPPGNVYTPRLSHDGHRIAVDVSDVQGMGDIWLYDVDRPVATRFTFDPANESDPVWSPDDSRIVFSSSKGEFYLKPTAGIGAEEALLASPAQGYPTDWSVVGSNILFTSRDPETMNVDLWTLSTADGKAKPYLATSFNESAGVFSPDGMWIAYVSGESGRPEVYVQPFPAAGGKWQISTDGGQMPVWGRDGKEIFYLARDRSLMAVSIKTAPIFESEAPRLLFAPRTREGPARQYDVSADGQRFLINTLIEEEQSTPLTLVVNWPAGLKP